jgi:hypothetical protein
MGYFATNTTESDTGLVGVATYTGKIHQGTTGITSDGDAVNITSNGSAVNRPIFSIQNKAIELLTVDAYGNLNTTGSITAKNVTCSVTHVEEYRTALEFIPILSVMMAFNVWLYLRNKTLMRRLYHIENRTLRASPKLMED